MNDSPPKVNGSADTTSKEPTTEDPDVPIDFSTFILSLSSSAAYHLGLAPHPDEEDTCQNLPMAKQTIDILSILQEKTKGNLTGEEERLLAEILYNLRMTFVRVSDECSSP
ncbi:MAG: DUF1844 domain-containing protein [Proteobacteria bacterium]|nr:DUF1844 domain-containing protein [Pseudomonadota bacterium]